MPSTRIETAAGWLTDHAGLIAAVQAAIVEGIRIPEHDRDIRIHEYPAHAFAAPPSRGPRYTVIEISLFSGRSIEAKRRLYAALAAALGRFGVPPTDIKIILHEADRENWGFGDKAGSDITLNFKVDV